MPLTTKFRKDLDILQAAANREVFLDVKNPKLYKKVKRYYQNEIDYSETDPDLNYSLVVECLRQDVTYTQTANPNATNSEFDGYR